MKNFKHILSIFIITSLILVSCSKDDTPAEVNEVETFTRVVLKVGSDTYTYNVGSTAPEIKLTLGTDYKTSAEIANQAAGIVCEEVGVVSVSKDSLKEIIGKFNL